MEKFALVIGNSEYEDQRLRKLETPGQDAQDLATVLQAPEIGGFQIELILNDSESKIRRAIERFFAKRAKDDLILFYFSGHGIRGDEGLLYFAVKDTDTELLRSTAVAATWVRDMMNSSYSRRQVLFLDCCFSGAINKTKSPVGTSVGTSDTFSPAGYGRVVLTASDAVQHAWEGEEILGAGTKSVFTHFLVEGIRTGAADLDEDGIITLDELHDYIYQKVIQTTSLQTPLKFVDSQAGQIPIALSPVTKIKNVPAALREAMLNPNPGIRRAATREIEKIMKSVDPEIAPEYLTYLRKISDDPKHPGADDARRTLVKIEPLVPLNKRVVHFRKPQTVQESVPFRVPEFAPLSVPSLKWQPPRVDDILAPKTEYSVSSILLQNKVRQIEAALNHLKIPAKVVEVIDAPRFTWFCVTPSYNKKSQFTTPVSTSKFVRLKDELSMLLASDPIEILAPVPGKSYIGIGLPKHETKLNLNSVFKSSQFLQKYSSLRIGLGFDQFGGAVVHDLLELGHISIGGQTGSGKSMLLHVIIANILLQCRPDDVRLLLADKVMVELSPYNGVAHLLSDVITRIEDLNPALTWLEKETNDRQALFRKLNLRDIKAFRTAQIDKSVNESLPYIVVIIDRFDSFLQTLQKKQREAVHIKIGELISTAQQVGIFFILTFQPSEAHLMPNFGFSTRITGAVPRANLAQSFLDGQEAVRLHGPGDMLLLRGTKVTRFQSAQMDESESVTLADYWRNQAAALST